VAAKLSGPESAGFQLDYHVWEIRYSAITVSVSVEAKKHRRAEGCPAVSLGCVATELNQQGSAEYHQETMSTC